MIPIDLNGRTALITGGESGLGAATAKSLAQAGADVAITYHNTPQAAEAVAASAKAFGVKAATVRLADVASQSGVGALFQWMDQEYGGVDILVNNAGIDGSHALCAEGDPAAWRRVIDVDLMGPTTARGRP